MLVHGVLHLLGYDHENSADADEMERLEAAILNDRGIANPYASTQVR
jgi:probable rRNA maturation factor